MGILVPKKLEKIPEDLSRKMLEAGSYQELLECIKALEQALPPDSSELDQFTKSLAQICRLFQSEHPACDSFVKGIFAAPDELKMLDEVGIPKVFLLQCVRIGAMKEEMDAISKNRHQPYDAIQYLRTNGFDWANQQLQIIAKDKKAEYAKAKELAATQLQAKKDLAIAAIGRDMNNPDFKLTDEQKQLLETDFRQACRVWKAFFEDGIFSNRRENNPDLKEFFSTKREQELTPQIEDEFKKLCEADPQINERITMLDQLGSKPKFEMLNPQSGWFYLAKNNNSTTLRTFMNNSSSNMDSWAKL